MHKLYFLLLTLTYISGCSEEHTQISQKSISTKVPELAVIKIKAQGIPVHYRAPGSIISDRRIDISSRISSFIQNIHVKEGERVSRGQLLVTLDSTEVDGLISKASASLQKSRTNLADAEIDVKQHKELYTRGSVSKNQLRKAILTRDQAINALSETQGLLKSSKSQHLYTKIISPSSGIVIRRDKQSGDLTTAGQSLLTIESDQQLLFDTHIPEKLIAKIKKGEKVYVDIDAANRREGIIARIIPSADPITRRYQVKILVDDTIGLLPGMFGRATFELGSDIGVVVPRNAVVHRGGIDGVFVFDESTSSVSFRWIRLGAFTEDGIQVLAGLSQDQKIVIPRGESLRNGDKVDALKELP